MPSVPLFVDRFRRPTIGFNELLRKNAGGALLERGDYAPFMFRALVIAADTEGGKLETPDGRPEGSALAVKIVNDARGTALAEYTIVPTVGPRNPKNSIRARIMSSDLDQSIDDDHLRTYWPMFPGMGRVSPGEMAYVVFEDDSYTHGLWIGRVPSNSPDDNANQILMSDQLKQAFLAGQKVDLYGGGPAAPGSPSDAGIRQPRRLTNLYINK